MLIALLHSFQQNTNQRPQHSEPTLSTVATQESSSSSKNLVAKYAYASPPPATTSSMQFNYQELHDLLIPRKNPKPLLLSETHSQAELAHPHELASESDSDDILDSDSLTPINLLELSPIEKIKHICQERLNFYESHHAYLRDKSVPIEQRVEYCKKHGSALNFDEEVRLVLGCRETAQEKVLNEMLDASAEDNIYKNYLEFIEWCQRSHLEEEHDFLIYSYLQSRERCYLRSTAIAHTIMTDANNDIFDESQYIKEMKSLLEHTQGELYTAYVQKGTKFNWIVRPVKLAGRHRELPSADVYLHDRYAGKILSNIQNQIDSLQTHKEKLPGELVKKLFACLQEMKRQINRNVLISQGLKDHPDQDYIINASHSRFFQLVQIEKNVKEIKLVIRQKLDEINPSHVPENTSKKNRRRRKNKGSTQQRSSWNRNKSFGAKSTSLEANSIQARTQDDDSATSSLLPSTSSATPASLAAQLEQNLLLHGMEKENKALSCYSSPRPFLPGASQKVKVKKRTFREIVTKRLSHNRNFQTYMKIFEVPTPHMQIRGETLEKVIKWCGGVIESRGKTVGSGRRIILPIMNSSNDQLWATLLEEGQSIGSKGTAGGLHCPHEAKAKSWMVRAVGDALTRAGFHPDILFPEHVKKMKLYRNS